MSRRKISRRSFLRNTSLAAAGSIAGSITGGAGAETTAEKEKLDTSKILNYNPKMPYQRLGKTELVISRISLGGHWHPKRGGYWGSFAHKENPTVPDWVAKNRTEVVSCCIDHGVNLLDITSAEECMCYGAAIKGRREKMIVGADDSKLCPRHDEYINVKDQIHNVEQCLKHLGSDYLDIWRVQAKMDGANTDSDVEIMIEAFEKLHKQGKVRHFGLSTHSRPWALHVIENFPEVEMFIFPCTARTQKKGQAPTPENVVEVNAESIRPTRLPSQLREEDTQQIEKSVFTALKEHDVGLITIKPFFGGNLFNQLKGSDAPDTGVGSKAANDLARLTLQCILNVSDSITAVIPGLSTVYEAQNAALAAYTLPAAMNPAEYEWIQEKARVASDTLPKDYRWLRDWEVI